MQVTRTASVRRRWSARRGASVRTWIATRPGARQDANRRARTSLAFTTEDRTAVASPPRFRTGNGCGTAAVGPTTPRTAARHEVLRLRTRRRRVRPRTLPPPRASRHQYRSRWRWRLAQSRWQNGCRVLVGYTGRASQECIAIGCVRPSVRLSVASLSFEKLQPRLLLVKDKGSPYSITERRFPELIPVLVLGSGS